MRIAYVTHVGFPDVAHDPFHSTELAKKMTARGHKTTIITWNKRDPTTNRIERVDGVDFWRLGGVNFKLSNIITEYPFVFGMNSAFKQLQPDIIHAHSHLFATSLQAVTNANRLGLPTVITVHGVFADRALPINLAQHSFLRTFSSMILKNVNRIVCLTRSDVNEIMRLGCPRERIRLIPNAVDTVRFRPGKRREDNLIVWVGRFVPEKGLEYLIEAARITAKKVKDARFLLVGYGPLKARIEKLARDYGLLGRVIMLAGPLEAEGVAEILGQASVFVLSSLKEGLPIAVLEAMACGDLVISSDIPGVRDTITHGENGILVPPRNPQALADAIIDLLGDDDRRKQISQKARERMIKEYSWDKIVERMERVYFETLETAS